MTKKNTTSENNPFNTWFTQNPFLNEDNPYYKMMINPTMPSMENYTQKWLDSVERMQDGVMDLQKMIMERTVTAMDEAHRAAKENLEKTHHFMGQIHDMTKRNVDTFRPSA